MNPTMHDGWFFPFGGLLFILLSTLFVLALVFLARKSRMGDGQGAFAILDRRLASGEISEEEHAQVREVLRR